MADKPHMNIVFIGHVDHGKSTLVGRMLLEGGGIDPHIIEQYKKMAAESGKASFEFAWVMDNLKEERERGVTIDVAHKEMYTDKYYFTIIDAPGHRDFVKNMITGTSQADAAVLVVAAPEGIMAQTKEHVFLARTLGVGQLIVALNKMDATKPEYSQDVFNQRKAEVQALLKTVGYKDDQVTIIPVSAFKGDNAHKDKGELSWWDGPSLYQALDNLVLPPPTADLPLRWPVQDVYTITGVGTVPVGRIETGKMKIGDNLIFLPSNKKGEVKSIEMHHTQQPEANPGDNVGCNIRGVSKNDVRRGDVAGPVSSPPSVAKSFTAQIIVLNHPNVITVGYTPVFHCHTAQVASTFPEIQKLIDPKTGQAVTDKGDQVKAGEVNFLKSGDSAIVKVTPTRPMVIEKAKEFPQLGRFAIRDMGQTVAAGMVADVELKQM